MKTLFIQRIDKYIDTYAKKMICIFIIGILITMCYSTVLDIRIYYYDSQYYWELSNSFIGEEGFSFLNYPQSFRGYFFPFLLFIFSYPLTLMGCDPVWGLRLLSAITLSTLCCILLPVILSELTKRSISLIQRLIPLVLILFFWRGLILYPLSDMYSLTFALSAIVLVIYMTKMSMKTWISGISALAVGILFYAAYNTRTIYLFSIAALVAVLLFSYKKIGIYNLLFWAVFISVGFFLAAIPQILINHHNLGLVSIEVITDMVDKSGLFSAQLFTGIIAQGYESNINPDYPIGALRFEDPVGWKILNSTGGWRIGTITDYLNLVLRYPLEFVGIYLRHLATYLNPVYGEVYISNFYKPKFIYTVLNYLILCYGILLIRYDIENIGAGNGFKKAVTNFINRIKYAIPIIMPCIAILPGQPEGRFFFPLYVLAYGLFSFIVDSSSMWKKIKSKWTSILLITVITFLVLCSFWSMEFSLPHVEMPMFTLY